MLRDSPRTGHSATPFVSRETAPHPAGPERRRRAPSTSGNRTSQSLSTGRGPIWDWTSNAQFYDRFRVSERSSTSRNPVVCFIVMTHCSMTKCPRTPYWRRTTLLFSTKAACVTTCKAFAATIIGAERTCDCKRTRESRALSNHRKPADHLNSRGRWPASSIRAQSGVKVARTAQRRLVRVHPLVAAPIHPEMEETHRQMHR